MRKYITLKTKYQLKDLAKSAGVSESTVSRVLNGMADKYRIGKETQTKVEQLAKDLDFIPDQLARSLRLKKTKTLGLIIPDITNPFFAGIAHAIEQEARAAGYFVILSVSEEDASLEHIALQQLTARNVDGIIISPVGNEKVYLHKFYQSKIPMVLIDRYFEGEPWPYVTSDNRLGGFLATEHLIQNGHSRIACIQGTAFTTPNTERVQGYLEALEHYNMRFNTRWLTGDNFGKENGYHALEYLLSLSITVRPTAIFALSNLISLGVLDAMREKALLVPDDFSLIAFDEQPYSSFLATAMTTIGQNIKEIGSQALNYLIQRIEDPLFSQGLQKVVPTTLISRNSVRNISNPL